jgi:hypothetical protein
MHLVIVRDTTRADATLGTLTIGNLALQTLELPWVPVEGALCGHPDTSCVPVGDYSLVLHNSADHPKSFALLAPDLGVYVAPTDIPAGCVGRSECLLHVGNYPRNSKGCILLGQFRHLLPNGASMISDSVWAVNAFDALVPWVDGHTISITEAPAP